jgi:flavin reductase (DIM6/NTAB) family NADH-FMN oxidoreductase RutF
VATDPQAPPQEFDFPISSPFAEGLGQSFLDEIPPADELDLDGDDPALEFRRTLGMFPTGVTIITTQSEGQAHGMTANAFMSVSLQPPLVVISVDRRAKMHSLLHEGAHYGISILGDEQEALSDHFAGRPGEPVEAKFLLVRDTPLVDAAVAHIVARVVRSYWGGDHSLFLGQVEYARSREGAPLLFHGGRYEHVLAGAPVFGALPKERLAQIVAAGEERSYADGEAIVRDGDPGDELFVVLEGTVRIERRGRFVATLGEADLFGEVAVLDGRSRSADAFAEGAVRAMAIPREAVRAAIEAEPQVAWELLGLLASRMRDA